MTYLDTNVVLYLYQGNLKKLTRAAAQLIDRADQLLISPMVEVELDVLFRSGRLATPSGDILRMLQARIGLAMCELPFAMVTNAALSIGWTNDVFDRIIVAQAAATGSELITSDTRIRENYPGAVW